MSEQKMLYCLIAFILGWLASRIMGNGFSVGGQPVVNNYTIDDLDKLKEDVPLLLGKADVNRAKTNINTIMEHDPTYTLTEPVIQGFIDNINTLLMCCPYPTHDNLTTTSGKYTSAIDTMTYILDKVENKDKEDVLEKINNILSKYNYDAPWRLYNINNYLEYTTD